MDKILLDTDVLLDFFFDRKPFADAAAEILNRCAEKEIQGFTTPVIVSNVYYMLSKSAKHEIIVEKLKQLLTIIDVVDMNRTVVLNALNSKFKDFEDALQNYSVVEHSEISMIITRNIKDYKRSELAVFTPEMYVNGLKTTR